MNYQTLKIQFVDGVANLILSRPEVRNAFHPDMIGEITQAITELGRRTDVRVVILRGEGKSFCSGADLGYMKAMAAFTIDENQRDAEDLFTMFATLRACPHPLIGILHGHVMGGGLGLAAVCDIAAAFDGTQFCFSEVRLGLVPAVISPFVLERMAAADARRYMLTGEVFGAADALRSGLVQFSGSAGDVEVFVANCVQQFRQNGPESVRHCKSLLAQLSERRDWNERRKLTTSVIAERRVSAEGQEGLKAFFEKRQPGWRK